MIYLYLFGTCFHFIYVFMIIGKIITTLLFELLQRGEFFLSNSQTKQNLIDKIKFIIKKTVPRLTS